MKAFFESSGFSSLNEINQNSVTLAMVEANDDGEAESTYNKILAVVYPRVRSFLSGTCSGREYIANLPQFGGY